ncbi:MAG: homoserine dehydrogenase, partial [Gaiellales bacterium]|nr:homoserine dehydrogenase [Gaiellales bacterium]
MTSEPLGIGLLGYGTVGSSVDRLLRERADVVERVAGRPVRVVRALVRDAARTREGAAPGLLTDRFEDIRDDPSIKVVAEVMGGVEPTLGYLRELLERGVSVVSANKQLLARHGAELQQAADRGGAQLRYEASACAAIPVVRVLQESLAAAGVDELIGIVNGTTNFMLSAMAREGQSYADALAEAQALGYAEADPTEDVGGADAAAKLAILASLAFHRHLHIDDVPFEGIDTLHDDDVAFSNELGYAVKLLAHARLSA